MQTDYLVKGCGASAMAFVDAMLRETNATFTLVDRRAAPGGHWNDAYPFVRLHQPSASYGVASRALGHGRKDVAGFNQGFYELASGFEVADYFHQVMRDTFLPSGRVRYYPVCEVVDAEDSNVGEFVSLLSGERHRVEVRKKRVDATLLNTSIPLTHTRRFTVADGVACIPPNDLARIAPRHTRFTVMGAGKTAIDSVLWLLANGARPEVISWVLPRDPWMINRANFQPGEEFFAQCLGALATQHEIAATATSMEDLCRRMEANSLWLRLDPDVWPTMFHGATVTSLELEQLRKVKRIIRKQRVQGIERERLILDGGEISSHPDELYIDCTARALAANVNESRPVFSPGHIRLQMIRQYQPTFSAALIGHIEATVADAGEQAQLAQAVRMTDTVEDWAATMVVSMGNQAHWSSRKELADWLVNCRLDLYGRPARQVREDEPAKLAILARIKAHGGPAVQNLRRLSQVSQSR
jgi:hypothetical protein